MWTICAHFSSPTSTIIHHHHFYQKNHEDENSLPGLAVSTFGHACPPCQPTLPPSPQNYSHHLSIILNKKKQGLLLLKLFLNYTLSDNMLTAELGGVAFSWGCLWSICDFARSCHAKKPYLTNIRHVCNISNFLNSHCNWLNWGEQPSNTPVPY